MSGNMENILNKLIQRQHVSTGATIFMMFTYTFLLNRDLACTCEPQNRDCSSYMALPFFIIFILTLWTSKSFLVVCRYTCTSCCSEGCRIFCSGFLLLSSKVVRALSVGLLWVVFILIDGDWYVCCQNDGSEEEMMLSCKSTGSLTGSLTDSDLKKISGLKNTSRIIGGGLLLGIVIVGFLMELLVRIKCCKSSSSSNGKFQFYKLILKEEGGALEKVLKKSAQDQLNEQIQTKITGRGWEDCFNVADELIRQSVRPMASGEAPEEQELNPMGRGAEQLEEQ